MFERQSYGTQGHDAARTSAPDLEEPLELVLRSVLTAPPGVPAADVLADIDPTSLDQRGQLLLLQAWERQARWVAARQQAVLAAVAGPAPQPRADDLISLDDWINMDVAATLRLAPSTADRRLAVARRLAGPLTATAAALGRGEISYLHAVALAEGTEELSDAVARSVEARLLPTADGKPVGRFRRVVARAVAAADPIGAELRHAEAKAACEVNCWPEGNGMGCLQARLPAAGVALIDTALTAGALALGPDDRRSMDTRRAEVLISWARTALEDPSLPSRHRRRPHVQVTIDLPTLLGLADNPGELAGHGPIPASAARALAADGEWRRMVTDPTTGTLLDFGRRTYVPPAALVDFLLARDGTCRFPGCPRPAELCDLDHQIPWDQGGTTDRANMGPLCRRHHRLKTHTGWQLKRNPDASVTWISPAGLTYRVRPPTVPPDG